MRPYALSAGNGLNLLNHYENNLHRTYQRALHNFLVFRELGADENNQTNLDSDKPC